MISKERLLAGLNESIYIEEGMITLYANFAKALLKETRDIEEKTKDKIIKLLSGLYRDSTRHKESIESLIKDITKSAINEY
ncbi:MAG: hypothetical protein A2Z72_07860 [Omnitrophica bacterium RBG_13_46_9]|nr:MAG: hypothetical protein A2Z72_07860 [Omnitrophica bacterium RBG_13_46_9]